MNKDDIKLTIIIVSIIVIVIGLLMYGCPKYNVWSQGLKGQAELRRAEQNRKIAVQEAEAKKDSAKALAEAEIIRAGGVAEANKIIGNSLKNNEGYLRYLYIQGLSEPGNAGNVIYIPTEAGLPILEATRR
jgi:regulator of protease activity HflC (stomatin/prohibitin superfamily)